MVTVWYVRAGSVCTPFPGRMQRNPLPRVLAVCSLGGDVVPGYYSDVVLLQVALGGFDLRGVTLTALHGTHGLVNCGRCQ